jgi:DNA repair ATPase RecN
MSKYAQLAQVMEEADSKALNGILAALNQLDALTDKRFEAFDEVIQSQADMIEDVEKKVDQLLKKPAPVDHTAELEAVKQAIASLRTLCNRPYPVVDLRPLQDEVQSLAVNLGALEQEQLQLRAMLDKLLTAKRVPEYDTFGNVIAVRLEIH